MGERMSSHSQKQHPSLFAQLIRGAATRIASDPRVPEQNRAALADAAEHVIWQQWRDIFGGQRVRLRAPDVEPIARERRSSRIERAIANGEPFAEIAQREQVGYQAVYARVIRARKGKLNK